MAQSTIIRTLNNGCRVTVLLYKRCQRRDSKDFLKIQENMNLKESYLQDATTCSSQQTSARLDDGNAQPNLKQI